MKEDRQQGGKKRKKGKDGEMEPRNGKPGLKCGGNNHSTLNVNQNKNKHNTLESRTFYHSRTCQPMTMSEILDDKDSDDEVDVEVCVAAGVSGEPPWHTLQREYMTCDGDWSRRAR